MEGGREQNYWPGFVDALSNVVLTLLFVIVVFVFALATGMNKAAEEMSRSAEAAAQQKFEKEAANIANAQVQQLEQANEDLVKRLAQAEADLRNVTAEHDSTLKAATLEVTGQPQALPGKHIGVEVAGDRIVITYPDAVADLDAKASDGLNKALDAFKGRLGKRKITIRSIEGGEPFSAAQRYAYYRAVAIRNVLLSHGIAAAAEIKSTVLPVQGEGGGRVEIRF